MFCVRLELVIVIVGVGMVVSLGRFDFVVKIVCVVVCIIFVLVWVSIVG